MGNNFEFDYGIAKHVETMQQELDELKYRINGFEQFISSDEFEERIPDMIQQQLAKRQLTSMKDYRDILEERIKYFKNEFK